MIIKKSIEVFPKRDTPHLPPYLVRGKLNKGIVKAFLEIKKLWSPSYRMQEVYDNALIYGYKGGTTNKSWTIAGRKSIARYLHTLTALVNGAQKYNWGSDRVKIKDHELEEIVEYVEDFYKSDPNVHGTLSDIFEITLHYKFIRDNEAPNIFLYEGYLELHQALANILQACWHIQYMQDKRAKKRSLIEDGIKTVADV